MIKSTLVAAAATLAIAVGSLGAGTASAQPYGGPSAHGGWHGPHGPNRVCKPVFRTVRVHGAHGWYVKKVSVGHRCVIVKPRHW